ncbi:hypothetical protein B0H14DRAFT_3421595 [Mycena olivaceomarginata]|nr:hypothetical protein B0H14DRAFT_3421595 [Mycena olivaceomarginata]
MASSTLLCVYKAASGNFPALYGCSTILWLWSASALSDAVLVEKIVGEEDWARLRASLDRANLTLRVVDVSS